MGRIKALDDLGFTHDAELEASGSHDILMVPGAAAAYQEGLGAEPIKPEKKAKPKRRKRGKRKHS